MKNCPDCQYPNRDDSQRCEICLADIAAVSPVAAAGAAKKVSAGTGGLKYAAGLLAAVAVVAAGIVYHGRNRQAAPAQPPDLNVLPPQQSAAVAPDTASAEDTVNMLRSLASLRLPGEEEIRAVENGFKSSDPAVRAEALETLSVWLENGVANFPNPGGKFVAAAKDANPLVRAEALLKIGLVLESVNTGRIAADLLGAEFRRGLKTVLFLSLKEPYEAVRENAAFCAGALRDADFLAELKRIMNVDGDIVVSLAAAGALVKLGDADAAGFLARNCGHGDSYVRRLAVQYLAYSPDSKSEAALNSIMKKDADPGVREAAGLALKARKALVPRDGKFAR